MKNKFKKIIFFGQGPHAKCVKKWCKKNKVDFMLITSPRLKQQKDIKNLLLENGKFLITKTLNIATLKNIVDNFTLGISAGSPFIFTKDIISLFKNKLYNLHGAPLPQYRGGASISWMILSGKKKWQTTIHEIDSGIDTGNILLKRSFIFPKKIKKPYEYHSYLWKQDLILLSEFLCKLNDSKSFLNIKQENKQSVYYPRLKAEVNGWIDFTWENHFIENFIFAFSHDYGGARTLVSNQSIKIFSAKCLKNIDRARHPFVAGLVLNKIKDFGLIVATGKGDILIEEYETLHNIKEGDRLYSPHNKLDNSFLTRVKYYP